MLPLILAAVGGYLVYDSVKSGQKFAKGGIMADGGDIDWEDAEKKLESAIKNTQNPEVKAALEKKLMDVKAKKHLLSNSDIKKLESAIANSYNPEVKAAFLRKLIKGVPFDEKQKYRNQLREIELEYADGGMMADGGRVFVGKFNEKQLRNKEDKIAIEKKMKETGLKYVDSKIIMKNGKPHMMEVYLYAKGGIMADGGNIYKNVFNGYTFNTEEEAKKFIKSGKPFLRKQLREGNYALVYNGKEYFIAEVSKVEMASGGITADGGDIESLYTKLVKEYSRGNYESMGMSFDSFLKSKMDFALEKGNYEMHHKLIEVQDMYENDF